MCNTQLVVWPWHTSHQTESRIGNNIVKSFVSKKSRSRSCKVSVLSWSKTLGRGNDRLGLVHGNVEGLCLVSHKKNQRSWSRLGLGSQGLVYITAETVSRPQSSSPDHINCGTQNDLSFSRSTSMDHNVHYSWHVLTSLTSVRLFVVAKKPGTQRLYKAIDVGQWFGSV